MKARRVRVVGERGMRAVTRVRSLLARVDERRAGRRADRALWKPTPEEARAAAARLYELVALRKVAAAFRSERLRMLERDLSAWENEGGAS